MSSKSGVDLAVGLANNFIIKVFSIFIFLCELFKYLGFGFKS